MYPHKVILPNIIYNGFSFSVQFARHCMQYNCCYFKYMVERDAQTPWILRNPRCRLFSHQQRGLVHRIMSSCLWASDSTFLEWSSRSLLPAGEVIIICAGGRDFGGPPYSNNCFALKRIRMVLTYTVFQTQSHKLLWREWFYKNLGAWMGESPLAQYTDCTCMYVCVQSWFANSAYHVLVLAYVMIFGSQTLLYN